MCYLANESQPVGSHSMTVPGADLQFKLARDGRISILQYLKNSDMKKCSIKESPDYINVIQKNGLISLKNAVYLRVIMIGSGNYRTQRKGSEICISFHINLDVSLMFRKLKLEFRASDVIMPWVLILHPFNLRSIFVTKNIPYGSLCFDCAKFRKISIPWPKI